MLLLALLPPLLLGTLLARLALPGSARRLELWLLCAGLGIGLGLGLSSCSYLFWKVLFGRAGSNFVATETLVLIALALLAWVLLRRQATVCADVLCETAPPGAGALYRFVQVALACAAIGAICAFVTQTLMYPHANWDAMTIWNLRARFLFRSEEHWRDAFTHMQAWSKPDYPPLVSAAIARVWEYTGAETLRAPALVAFLFALATTLTLWGALALARGRLAAGLGALLLLGTWFFILQSTWQSADIPLAAYMLATLGCLYLAETSCDGRRTKPDLACAGSSREASSIHTRPSAFVCRTSLLAGLSAGLAAWTKNEGLAFLVVVVLVRAIVMARVAGLRQCVRSAALFLLGAAPMLAWLIYFKLCLAPANWLATGQTSATVLARITDFSRWTLIGKAFCAEMGRFGEFIISPLPLLLAYGFAAGIKIDARGRASFCVALLVIPVMLCVYAGVYLLTPLDLAPQLEQSLARLLLQLWPASLLVYFLAVRMPDRSHRRGD